MARSLFRKSAVDRLSSHDQLDTLPRLTSPRGWLILAAAGLLVAAAAIWAVASSQPVTVQSQGVLVRPGGVVSIRAVTGGRLTDVRIRPNDHVNRGDVIARVRQPELLDELAGQMSRKQALSANDATERAGIDARIAQLQTLIEERSRVVSPYDGRVIGVASQKYDQLSEQDTVATLELDDGPEQQLQAVMYIPVQIGKKLVPGMEAKINPSSASKEEYGNLLGRVVSVAEYPATEQSMMNTLGNEAFVRQFAGAGPALLEVRIEILVDPSTPSGYRWSTKQGPPMTITSGTLMTGEIILYRQKPISYVIPIFR
ncbi:MAG: NHLP bacteriocin system secretion protein [Paenibacillaceae bacterium]|nr:NHLP bacteriocin system secretion protein [Paenibacillaceae bacterium]